MATKGGIAGTVRDTAGGVTDTARGAGDTARSTGESAGGGIVGGVKKLAESNPATQRLFDEATHFAQAKGRHLMSGLTGKVSGVAQHLDDYAESGGSSPLLKGAAKMAEGKSPLTAAVSAGVSSAKDKVTDKVKDVFGRNGTNSDVKAVSIIEEIDVGAPRSVVYNQWTQFTEFATFTKGVKSADQEDPVRVKWRAKIFLSTRTWDAEITEQIPDQRIAWKSSGDKGTVDGAVTFHELTPDLTKVILQLEYHPHGLFEKTGNLWRAQGRRARLDLKHFRRFVMMRGEETGAWRGEIRDGEVVPESEQPDQGGDERDRGDQQGRGGDQQDRGGDRQARGRDRREQDRSDDEDRQGRQPADGGNGKTGSASGSGNGNGGRGRRRDASRATGRGREGDVEDDDRERDRAPERRRGGSNRRREPVRG